ncbi:MAG: aminotransferase class I/II-fold pyridoxal phosphate-dependent enzyme [Geminicoccaceae bacterium]|nr:aminotransferase class I/II-fold pyridoxal phosphate-dependent enzyme [Geminicoccaceae bacterium]
MWNPRLADLSEFPFRRLAGLLAPVAPPQGLGILDLGIGEPKHRPPSILAETVAAEAGSWNLYPPPNGTPAFREAVARWCERRFDLPPGTLEPERMVLPLAGTKEGLYMLAALAVAPRADGRRPAVLMPSPLYAVYLGAAVMAGAEAVPLAATAENGFLPDLDALEPDLLDRTALFYLCSPANPQGVVASGAYLAKALGLARRHGFLLALDECYSEIWDEAPPTGGLAVAHAAGKGFGGLVVLNSLSKRSSAAGLRSGFVAGDPDFLAAFIKLRAYAAPVQPLPLMAAAVALWNDEAHVEASRDRYRRKIDLAERRLAGRLGFYRPPGGFFLWLDVGDGEAAALRLWREAGVRVLPGGYLTPGTHEPDPGERYVRVALVHDGAVVDEALSRLVSTLC